MNFLEKSHARYRRRRHRKAGPGQAHVFTGVKDFVSLKKLVYLYNCLRHIGSLSDDTIFRLSMQYFTRNQLNRIISSLYKRAKSKKLDVDNTIQSYRKGEDGAVDTLVNLMRTDALKPALFKAVLAHLHALIEQKGAGIQDPDGICSRLGQIGSIFELNPIEIELLLAMYLKSYDAAIDSLSDQLCDSTGLLRYPGRPASMHRALSIMTGHTSGEVTKALSRHSTIIKAGLISDEGEIAGEVSEFLAGTSSTPITGKYFAEYGGESVPLEYHTIDKKHLETIRNLIAHKPKDAPVNILLYGEPGTGKTEFSRSLGRHLGMPIFEIRNLSDDEKAERNMIDFRYRALIACQRIIDVDKSIIVVDEADAMLNSEPEFFSLSAIAEKGQINRLLDQSRGTVIWITNRYDGIDESTKRRFDYSIEFQKLTFTQRRAIWRMGLKKHNLQECFSDEELEHFAAAYETSAGGIDIALRNASRMHTAQKPKDQIVSTIDNVLKAHLKIVNESNTLADTKLPNAPEYSLDGLNIKSNISDVMRIIDRFNASWTAMGDNPAIRNMNLLLYGPPGTGKTEFAKYVARRLNRRLIVKRGSDLLSMWVGMTEKNIRRAFAEAEQDRAVLFIDEADSFLGSRENAVRSWEITQVNEILTNMENFRGMLICSTNFKRIVDSAAVRRFTIKMAFDYLNAEGAMIFYNLFFGKLIDVPLPDSLKEEVRTLPYLTPGDFKVVYQKYSFFEKNEIGHEVLVEALREELRAKDDKYGKTMGFGKA